MASCEPANSSLNLVLASASERRLKLLHQIGIVPDVVDPAGVDECQFLRTEAPTGLVARLGRRKAEVVFARHPGCLVLGADTVVACGRRVLNKPENVRDARSFLGLLSGRRHRVHTGLCLIGPGKVVRERLVTTIVRFKSLSAQEIQTYLDAGEWHGKAGAYAVQGRAGAFVTAINGSYSNVVGLPLYETYALLMGSGYRFFADNLGKCTLV